MPTALLADPSPSEQHRSHHHHHHGAGQGHQKFKNKTSIAAIVKSKPQAKKLAALRLAEAQRKARLDAEVAGWMEEFDLNRDSLLQRDELRALLTHLHPERPPTEETLDFLIERATAIESYSMRIKGNPNGDVSWHEVRPTVVRFHEYCKDQKYLDAIFRRFDADNNGTFDPSELPALLRAVAPSDCTVTDADVAYIFEQCDENHDGVISRNEVMPMLASWTRIAVSRSGGQEPPSRLKQQWDWLKDTTLPVGKRLFAITQQARQHRQQRGALNRSRWQSSAAVVSAGSGMQRTRSRSLVALIKAAKIKEEHEEIKERCSGLASGMGAIPESPRQQAAAEASSSRSARGRRSKRSPAASPRGPQVVQVAPNPSEPEGSSSRAATEQSRSRKEASEKSTKAKDGGGAGGSSMCVIL